MDSRKSLEFIRTLIARSENEPEIKEILKKATLMNKVAQVFATFDDGHLENLYEMNVNRAGAKMFLQALKGEGKAPKQVVIQSHPNHVAAFKKFFPSAVPFMVKSLSISTKNWDGSEEAKSKKDDGGFYNDLNELVSYLKELGFQAPFKIKVTGKAELTLTYVEEPPESKLLFDNLLSDAKALSDSMRAEQQLYDKEKDLKVEVARLREEATDEQDNEESYELEHRKSRRKSTRLEQELSSLSLSDAAYEPKKKETEKALKDADKAGKTYQEAKTKRQKAFAAYNTKRNELREIRNSGLYERVKVWNSLDWEGGTPTEKQLGQLMLVIGGYEKLRGNLPYKKVITVKLSCAIKSSSGGYDQGNFKNLRDFIKTSIF